MREESAFVPKAESFANALGLTQMLVRTAQRFATWHVTARHCSTVEELDVGSPLPGVSAGPLRRSLAPGHRRIHRRKRCGSWLRERALGLDEFLETIPYDETRNYTKRVLASVFAYSWLYGQHEPVPALSFALPKIEARKPMSRRKSSWLANFPAATEEAALLRRRFGSFAARAARRAGLPPARARVTPAPPAASARSGCHGRAPADGANPVPAGPRCARLRPRRDRDIDLAIQRL